MKKVLVREVPKQPDTAPKELSQEKRQLLTELCFREREQGPTDLFFCFGTNCHYDRQAQVIIDMLDQGFAKRVVLTGGKANYNDVDRPILTESLQVFGKIPRDRFPDVEFFLEKESTNTLENVLFALKLADFSTAKHITYSAQSIAAGRSYLTLRRFFPNAQIAYNGFDNTFPGESVDMTRENWFERESGIQLVWGELLRIKRYGMRGHIHYDDKTRALVSKILN